MSKNPTYRTINTATGDTIHLVEIPGENPKPHSIYGPSWIYADGTQEYYIYGLRYNSESSWEKAVSYYRKTKKALKED
jgi:hypothetical protein